MYYLVPNKLVIWNIQMCDSCICKPILAKQLNKLELILMQSTIQKFGVIKISLKKLILLFSKDVLN